MNEITTVPDITSFIPEKYRWIVTFLIVLVPLAGRGWHALKTGGGIMGVWNAIMFGTNQPRPKVKKEIEKEKVPPTTLGLFLVLALVLGLTACTTAPKPPGAPGAPAVDDKAVLASVKLAAFVGTAEALRQQPDWREHFLTAADALLLLQQKDAIGLGDIYGILQQLPIKELKSDRAVLYINAAAIVLEEYDAGTVDISKVARLRPVIRALYEGIELGLKSSKE